MGLTRLLGVALGWLVGSVLRVRRRHVELAMRRAGIAGARSAAARMYRSLGVGVFELLGLGLSPAPLSGQVELDAVLRQLRGLSPNGAVVATAHTGNWDLVACAVAERTPLTVITKHLSIRWLDRLWQGLRRRRGVELVSVGAAGRAALKAVAEGRWVATLVDQAPERSRAVCEAPFLGQRARVDLTPALLALRARCPLIVAFPERLHDGRHSLALSAVLAPPARPTRQWAVDAMTEVTRLLDVHVRAHPEQWLWMHRRWKR